LCRLLGYVRDSGGMWMNGAKARRERENGFMRICGVLRDGFEPGVDLEGEEM